LLPPVAVVFMTSTSSLRRPNRLAREKSPYLLQHKFNPVDWHAWGNEAFQRARIEDKPIFLSIGYSTCHWCHVMERESFEDNEVAHFLNTHFVSIKVDREERPDVDKIYMTYVQATQGGGGWPLNVFLIPELKPFFGGTYFPPVHRHGRASFLTVLQQIAEIWQTRRADINGAAAEITCRLAEWSRHESSASAMPGPDLLTAAAAVFKSEYEPRHGGFGDAPKFPRPSVPAFLLAQAVRGGDQAGIGMVRHTCERMAAGGMYDQLGGGFARYSVDSEWLVPHFEKMLYDNAQLVHLYLDAWLVTGDVRFATTVRETIAYVLRDLTHPDGGFYSAEDADSEGKEGKFYCWTRSEMAAVLPCEEFAVTERYFGVTEAGNFVDHSDPEPLPNQNILSIVDPALTPKEADLLASAKAKLLAARSRRVRPHLDDKVLASWNGLMLGALARAAAVLDEPAFLVAAEKNLAFLKARLWEPTTRTLFHRWRDGERDDVQLLDAYAFLLSGVVELYETTINPAHLEFGVELADALIWKFLDREAGGFWQTDGAGKDLILRLKEDYDGAEPSGNSVAALALLKLAAITDRTDFREAAEGTLRLFADRLRKLPHAVPWLLQALSFWHTPPLRVVLAGNPGTASFRTLLHAAHSVYQPHRVVLGTTGAVEPFARTLSSGNASAVAYVCTGTACQPPTSDPDRLRELLRTV
jgi:uncharacterized protein YyaL (SSP411 family)